MSGVLFYKHIGGVVVYVILHMAEFYAKTNHLFDICRWQFEIKIYGDCIYGNWKCIVLCSHISGLHLYKVEVHVTWFKYGKTASMENWRKNAWFKHVKPTSIEHESVKCLFTENIWKTYDNT